MRLLLLHCKGNQQRLLSRHNGSHSFQTHLRRANWTKTSQQFGIHNRNHSMSFSTPSGIRTTRNQNMYRHLISGIEYWSWVRVLSCRKRRSPLLLRCLGLGRTRRMARMLILRIVWWGSRPHCYRWRVDSVSRRKIEKLEEVRLLILETKVGIGRLISWKERIRSRKLVIMDWMREKERPRSRKQMGPGWKIKYIRRIWRGSWRKSSRKIVKLQ